MKKYIIGFIIDAIVFGSIGVYATVSYQASQIEYNNTTVEATLNDLYSKTNNMDTSAKKFCKFIDGTFGTAGNIGAKYECDPGDGTLRNFYVLVVDTNKVKLIMEQNITQGSGTTTMTWMNAMKYFRTGAGASKKAAWTNVIDVDLPMAQDIANAVGNTGWNMEDKNYDGWFYFDPNNGTYGQTQVANASNLSAYRWLYNYTRECKDHGCDAATSLAAGEAYGYWTRDIVAQQKDSTDRAWRVSSDDYLGSNTVSGDTNNGVRPVITVLKSNLYE